MLFDGVLQQLRAKSYFPHSEHHEVVICVEVSYHIMHFTCKLRLSKEKYFLTKGLCSL